MELETIKIKQADGTEAVINKTDYDPDKHTLPPSDKPAPKRRGRPRKAEK